MSFKKTTSALMAVALALPLAACDVDQTEEGDLPDVEVEEGNMPEYDVDGPQVTVEEDTVTVPDVDVEPPPENDR